MYAYRVRARRGHVARNRWHTWSIAPNRASTRSWSVQRTCAKNRMYAGTPAVVAVPMPSTGAGAGESTGGCTTEGAYRWAT